MDKMKKYTAELGCGRDANFDKILKKFHGFNNRPILVGFDQQHAIGQVITAEWKESTKELEILAMLPNDLDKTHMGISVGYRLDSEEPVCYGLVHECPDLGIFRLKGIIK